jgi:ubiquinone/menaquinone biosynthesis C-methylase UbiE
MVKWLEGIDPLDTIQVVLVVIISILLANYLYVRWMMVGNRKTELDNVEAFADAGAPDGSAEGNLTILGNETLYDQFYAKIYDTIVDGEVRQKQEVGLTLIWAKGFRPEVKTLQVLDIGSGTGGDVEEFRKEKVGKVVGLDAADSMVAVARKKFPKNDYRVGEAENIGLFSAGEYNLATMYYFTYYYLRDRDQVFRNIFNWLQPGGCLVVHLVNREKFDPILEAASPFVAFSVQKYAKDRITRSKVTFDKFEYEADFNLDDAKAEFREEFRFKGSKKIRRQVHHLRMPKMDDIVAEIENNGFTYKQFIDLTAIGYEYQYLFCFVR